MARLSILSLALLPLAAGAAEDWPQFRGPNRDNVSAEKGLLKSWPKGGPKLAWKCAGLGQGYSSVSVAGDQVYTMGDKGGAAYVFAVSRDKGEVVWERKVGRAGGNYAGTRCTPTVDDKRVYALGQFGDLVCLDADKGTVVWSKNLPRDFGGQAGGWNYTESPLVDGDRVIVTPGGRKATIVALDKKTGDEVWRSPLGDTAGYSSAVVSRAGGVRQYVQLLSGGTVGVKAPDGKLLWRYGEFAGNTANVPTPVVLGSQVFTAAGYGAGGALLSLSAAGKAVRARQVYLNRGLTNKHGGVVVVGAFAYGDTDDSGNLWCAAWKTGKVAWKRGRAGRGGGSASLTYADGNLYVHYANGWVALVPAMAKGYSERGSFRIPGASGSESWAHPVVCGGRLYLRDQDTLYVYAVK